MNALNNQYVKESNGITSSEKKGWKKVTQNLKAFFTAIPKGNSIKSEIDYYHQYVYPQKVEKRLLFKRKAQKMRTK